MMEWLFGAAGLSCARFGRPRRLMYYAGHGQGSGHFRPARPQTRVAPPRPPARLGRQSRHGQSRLQHGGASVLPAVRGSGVPAGGAQSRRADAGRLHAGAQLHPEELPLAAEGPRRAGPQRPLRQRPRQLAVSAPRHHLQLHLGADRLFGGERGAVHDPGLAQAVPPPQARRGAGGQGDHRMSRRLADRLDGGPGTGRWRARRRACGST